MNIAESLGYPADARIAIPHVDDVGMCHGANQAFATLAGHGFITCGSVMPPCPWMLEAADLAKMRSELDLGIHLTLTSEWRHYRWRPLIGSARSSGLVDEEGYLWRSARETIDHADMQAVEEEFRAQVEAVTSRGVAPSHVDCHMGTALAPRFAETFYRVCEDYALVGLMPRDWQTYLTGLHMEGVADDVHQSRIAGYQARGLPVIDFFVETPWFDARGSSDEAYRSLIRNLKPGVSLLALHPNLPGDIEVIDPLRFRYRIEEVRIFQSPDSLDLVHRSGVQLLSFRELVRRLQSQL